MGGGGAPPQAEPSGHALAASGPRPGKVTPLRHHGGAWIVQRTAPPLPLYHREVLSRPEISPLVKPQELGPLLCPETQQSLEEQCIAAVKVMAGQGWVGGTH